MSCTVITRTLFARLCCSTTAVCESKLMKCLFACVDQGDSRLHAKKKYDLLETSGAHTHFHTV